MFSSIQQIPFLQVPANDERSHLFFPPPESPSPSEASKTVLLMLGPFFGQLPNKLFNFHRNIGV
jgi:hypothetical protein